ncbi:MAG: Gfo/Idh/MocA family protein [Pirellulales bacterium]
MRSITYGVIGLGFFGEYHAQVAAALPHVKLRALASRQDKRRKQLKKQFGATHDYRDYHELLADPQIEAVSVVTHVDDHAEPVIAALKAGKHVLVEKPMARTVADCDRMIAAAKKAGRILMVGHICRFNPRYAVTRQRVQSGELGKIVSLYARRNIPAARSRGVLEKIGPLLGDGIHDTDLMLWMTGAQVETVYALTHSERDLKYPDIGWAMYRFDNGAIGVIENAWFLPDGTPFRIHEQMELIGTEGSAYIHGGDTNVVIQSPAGVDCPDTLYWPSMHGSPVGALRSEIEHFVDCVTRGEPSSVVTPQEARAAVAVLAAAEKSAATGKVCRV